LTGEDEVEDAREMGMSVDVKLDSVLKGALEMPDVV
jgi:hypothetical protein